MVGFPPGHVREAGHHEPTAAKTQIERFIHVRFLFEQDIPPADPGLGNAVFNINRHVTRFDEQKAVFAAHVVQNEPPAVGLLRRQHDTGLLQPGKGRFLEAAFGQGKRQHGVIADCARAARA